jgi:hypothetical protein
VSEERDGKWYAHALLSSRSKPSEGRLSELASSLERIPRPFLDLLVQEGIRAYPLAVGQRYGDASPEMRGLIGDAHFDLAGAFVVVERTAYLRELGPMCVVHELAGHGLDLALGGDAYFSGRDTIVSESYRRGEALNAYMSSSRDEFWAEAVRAYTDTPNEGSLRMFWRETSRERLESVSPQMTAYIAAIEDAIGRQQLRGQRIDPWHVLHGAREAMHTRDMAFDHSVAVDAPLDDSELPKVRHAEGSSGERERGSGDLEFDEANELEFEL